MKSTLLLILAIFGMSSNTKYEKKDTEIGNTIEIKFILNKVGNYSFSFRNNSSDTVYVSTPECQGTMSYFKLFNNNDSVVTSRCTVNHSLNNVQWLALIPNKNIVSKSDVNLKKYFCNYDESFSLGYVYCSYFKTKKTNKIGGLFAFDFEPKKISKIDSIFIVKKIF